MEKIINKTHANEKTESEVCLFCRCKLMSMATLLKDFAEAIGLKVKLLTELAQK